MRTDPDMGRAPRPDPTTTLSASASCSVISAMHGRYRSMRAMTCRCSRAHEAHLRLPPDLAAKLADYAARKRVPQALIVEGALASHLSPDGADRALLADQQAATP